MTTDGRGAESGSACWKWTSAGSRRRNSLGTAIAIRATWFLAGSSIGTIPSGTSSGRLVIAANRRSAGAAAASSRKSDRT